jgi:hypothetical protein
VYADVETKIMGASIRDARKAEAGVVDVGVKWEWEDFEAVGSGELPHLGAACQQPASSQPNKDWCLVASKR